jgi:uncharacterized membrane protein YesL
MEYSYKQNLKQGVIQGNEYGVKQEVKYGEKQEVKYGVKQKEKQSVKQKVKQSARQKVKQSVKQKVKQRAFDYSSGSFYYYIEKIFDLAALSLLWIITCLPLITIGAATSAFYYTTVKVIRRDKGYLAREYFHSFKQNFKSGSILWIITATISFLLQLNVGILYANSEGLIGLFFICFYTILAILIIGVMIYVFPILSRFTMKEGLYLKLALYITFRHLPITVILLIGFGIGVFILYYLPLLIIILPAGIMYFNSYLIEPILETVPFIETVPGTTQLENNSDNLG